MSPILDLQQREMESGRIRFGNKKGNRPNRLDHPLLTSADKNLIETVAGAYGSEVEPWPGGEGQWQTEVDTLNVLIEVRPEPFTAWWERWSGGGCMRRCDGITDHINEQPCDCDKTGTERACKPTTRFLVMLPETGEAKWRVETKSLNAAMEIPTALARATGERTGEVIPGVLSVEQRPGKKGKVPVPVIRLDASVVPDDASRQAPEIPSPPALPVGAVEAGGAEGGDPEPPAPQAISPQKLKALWAAAGKSYGEQRKEHVVRGLMADLAPGVESTKNLSVVQYEAIMAAVAVKAEPDE